MLAQPARPARVLLGNLEPLARVGMARLLAENGVEVPDDAAPSELVEETRRLKPDAVVLDLGASTTKALTEQVRAAAPGAKLILWARDETEMQVFDPGSSTARRISSAAPDVLLSELDVNQAERGRE